MEIIAYFGVGLAIVLLVVSVVYGTICAVKYVCAVIKFKTFIPLEQSEHIFVIGASYLTIVFTVLIVLFFVWSFYTIFNADTIEPEDTSKHRCYTIDERTSQLEKTCCTVVSESWKNCD